MLTVSLKSGHLRQAPPRSPRQHLRNHLPVLPSSIRPPSRVNPGEACPRLTQFYILGPGTAPHSRRSAPLADRHHNRQVALPLTEERFPKTPRSPFGKVGTPQAEAVPIVRLLEGEERRSLSIKLKFSITSSPRLKWESIALPLQAECFSLRADELQDSQYSITSNFLRERHSPISKWERPSTPPILPHCLTSSFRELHTQT